MKKYGLFILLLASFLISIWMVDKRRNISKVTNMKITSSGFQNNSKIPFKYTCDGENINPPLEFLDVPKDAKSLALIVDDPDAPAKTWVHWTIFNLDPKTKNITENSKLQNAVEGITSFEQKGYGGPCPQAGTHRYFFKLYALDRTLDLSESADKKQIEDQIQNHILEKAELIGLYSKKY